jgi:hypothetical protein
MCDHSVGYFNRFPKNPKEQSFGRLIIPHINYILLQSENIGLDDAVRLAVAYDDSEQWNEAETLLLEVVEMLRKILGESHPETLKINADLASIRRKQGREVKQLGSLSSNLGLLRVSRPRNLFRV